MKLIGSNKQFLVIFILIFNFLSLAAESVKIHGKIKNELGKPIDGATVKVQRSGNLVATVTTDKKGTFDFQTEVGDYTIVVEAEGYETAQISSGLTKKKTDIELTLSQNATLIRGTVFTERGFSFPNASVVIELVSSDSKKGKFHKQYTTNQSGEFAFRLPISGQYKLVASAKGYETDSKIIEINVGEAHNLAFSLIPIKNR